MTGWITVIGTTLALSLFSPYAEKIPQLRGYVMSHKHESLLRSIFDGPVSGNVHWREVESMLTHLGAKVEPHHGASFRVLLNGVEGFLHRPHNSNTCTKQELRHVRDYLSSAGVSPSQLQAEQQQQQ